MTFATHYHLDTQCGPSSSVLSGQSEFMPRPVDGGASGIWWEGNKETVQFFTLHSIFCHQLIKVANVTELKPFYYAYYELEMNFESSINTKQHTIYYLLIHCDRLVEKKGM